MLYIRQKLLCQVRIGGGGRGGGGEAGRLTLKIFVVFSMSKFKISQNLRADERTIHQVLTFPCTWIMELLSGV